VILSYLVKIDFQDIFSINFSKQNVKKALFSRRRLTGIVALFDIWMGKA